MSGGGMTSLSSSNQHSESGIGGQYRYKLSKRTAADDSLYGALTHEAANSPFGYFRGQSVDQLAPTIGGLPAEFSQYLNTVANQAMSQASAGGAMRGMLTPESTPGIVGSAITQMGGQVLPYVMDWSKYRASLPDELYGRRLGYYQALQGSRANMLGSRSDAWSNSITQEAHGGVGGGAKG